MVQTLLALLWSAALGALLGGRAPAFILALSTFAWLLYPGVGVIEIAVLFVLSAAAGAALEGRRGAALGTLLAVLGGAAWAWRPLLEAVGLVNSSGRFFAALLSTGLLLCAGAVTLFLRHGERRLAAVVLLLWTGLPWALERHLRSAWDYGPASLEEAAGVPTAGATPASAVLTLRPEPAEDYSLGQRIHSVGRLDASPESLRRVREYLDSRGFRSLFKREGLALLRRGWIDQWDADRAIEANSISVPGAAVPDYVAALELLRAGPVTNERFQKLEALHATATQVKGGFEDVNRSQRIFEAFHAAYARFGDEERSRWWILRVDNLWPLYEKKPEVVSLEQMRDGAVRGRVLLDGRPASSIKVGLFLEVVSEATGKRATLLSGSTYPDSEGAFSFEHLGPGTYHIELMGTPEQLQARVFGSPGLIELFEGSREVDLAPIMLERRPALLPPPETLRVLPGLQPRRR